MADNPQVIGDHGFRGADQKHQVDGQIVLGFERDPVAAATDGKHDLAALIGPRVGDCHRVTQRGVADFLALENFAEEHLEILYRVVVGE